MLMGLSICGGGETEVEQPYGGWWGVFSSFFFFSDQRFDSLLSQFWELPGYYWVGSWGVITGVFRIRLKRM